VPPRHGLLHLRPRAMTEHTAAMPTPGPLPRGVRYGRARVVARRGTVPRSGSSADWPYASPAVQPRITNRAVALSAHTFRRASSAGLEKAGNDTWRQGTPCLMLPHCVAPHDDWRSPVHTCRRPAVVAAREPCVGDGVRPRNRV
jgi:hypothetical protein